MKNFMQTLFKIYKKMSTLMQNFNQKEYQYINLNSCKIPNPTTSSIFILREKYYENLFAFIKGYT